MEKKNSHLFPTKQMRIYVGGELGVGLRLGGRYIDSLMEGTGVFLSFFFFIFKLLKRKPFLSSFFSSIYHQTHCETAHIFRI